MSGTQKSTQKTLFQAWKKPELGMKSSSAKSQNAVTNRHKETFSVQQASMACKEIDLTDDDLVEAAELLEATAYDQHSAGPSTDHNEQVESIPGFDNSVGHIWIYPTNYPVRDYQFSIVRNALLKNTLVSLPTGLGKTFIAAVVMYNFYRWYPQGKIVFMAPTKPLVSQQIEACYKIMGIAREDQAEITGMTTPVHKREALWSAKRVFFLTPQVINNDLARGVCPVSKIKCVVIDEAHKAQGRHAYCQVIDQLASCSNNFRVLALSATPGTDVKSVQQVITNLRISHIEIRSEDSIDIQQYSHRRNVEKIVCKLDATITRMKDNFLKVVETFTKGLVNRRALFDREVSRYSKYGLLMARDQFRKDPPPGLNKYEMGAIEGDFATCISLFHGLELLQQHGMRSFFIFLKAMMEGDKGNMRAKSVLGANALFREIYRDLKGMFGDSPNPTVAFTQAGQQTATSSNTSSGGPAYVYSHPKMAKLEEVVLKHFKMFTASHDGDATRVMVFCQYRHSVQEITELLQKHRPLIRPMQFVGHSTASGKIAKFTQKDQLQVVSKFRVGGYNTLVSTCVGEEGLDIGDVDLIVCFDAHKSPIRLVQRMGRTGRKRKGRIVMLVTEGKEERDYNSSLSNKKSIQKAITSNSGRNLQLYKYNPRMIPKGLNPQPHKMFMTIKQSEGNTASGKMHKNKKKNEPADISMFMKNVEKQETIFLNEQQAREWNEKLKLTFSEKKLMKALPTGRHMLSLGKNKPTSSTKLPELSLSEWTLWQTRLQTGHTIGHSTTTESFVEIMEICDIVKQSDDTSYEENLAPFLGAKYSKQFLVRKKKSKIDSFLDHKENKSKVSKPQAQKETNLVKDPSSESTSAADFAKPSKKIFPTGTSNHIHKPSIFACSDNADFKSGPTSVRDDDTLMGIDSILPDPLIIEESSNDSSVNGGSSKKALQAGSGDQNNNQEIEDLMDCNPHFDLGGLDDDLQDNKVEGGRKKNDDPLESVKDIHSNKSGLTRLRLTKDRDWGDFNDENLEKMNEAVTTDSPEVQKSSPLLGFVNTLSVLSTEAPVDAADPCNSKDAPKEIIRIPTPPSFDSFTLSLDFPEDIDVDDDEDLKKKPLKRACFALGNDDVKISNQSSLAGGSKNFQSDLESKQDVAISLTQNEVNNLPTKREGDLDGGKSHSSGPKDEDATNQSFEMSVDMFASEMDVDFDLGDVFDGTSLSSPILSGKKKSRVCSRLVDKCNSLKSGSFVTDICKNESLAKVTLTQRVENRALFADLPKFQNAGFVPVAEVKPQRSSSDDSKTTVQNYESHNVVDVSRADDIFDEEHCLKTAECGPSVTAKRKRPSSDEELGSGSKRRKNVGSPSNVSPHREVAGKHVVVETPEGPLPALDIHSGVSTDSEESPLIVKRRKRNCRAKMLFSQDTSHHAVSSDAENEILSNLIKKETKPRTKFLDQIGAQESPIQFFTSRNLKGDKQSTPKCAAMFSDDDDFVDENSAFVKFKRKDAEHQLPLKKLIPKTKLKHRLAEFIEDEAVVSDDGVAVSSDETEADDNEAIAEMRGFVNDATHLTQHVGDESTVDESAMYLREPVGLFKEPSKFQANQGRFKLAYDLGKDIDVFSQEVPDDTSGYEDNSFICDDDDINDDITALGEVTLLDDISGVSRLKTRTTRRQAELHKLPRMNYDSGSVTVSNHAPKLPEKKETSKQTRRRIVCMDDSADSSGDGEKMKENQGLEERWACPACTLLNPQSSQICELCDSEKPARLHGQKPGVTHSNLKPCKTCTYLNPSSEKFCKMCCELLENQTNLASESGPSTVPNSLKPLKAETSHTEVNTKYCALINKPHLIKPIETPGGKTSEYISVKEQKESAADIISATPVPKECTTGSGKNLSVSGLTSSSAGAQKGSVSLTINDSSNLSTSSDDREARLRRCREKQMEFRARMNRRKSQQSFSGDTSSTPSTSVVNVTNTSETTQRTSSLSMSAKSSLQFATPATSKSNSDLINSSISSPVGQDSWKKEKKVILVDSKVLNSGQPIITSLRCKHGVHVVVASLPRCDYIVGKGTAVERKVASDFAHVSNRQKLVNRFQQLNSNYSRIYLIIEQDRAKNNDITARRPSHSTYYNSTVCALSQTNLRILYSDSQDETAKILHTLASREKALSRSIDYDAAEKANDPKSRTLLRMYASIPRVSFVSSLYLCLNYKSFKEVASSSVEKLMQKAQLTTSSAAEVYSFFRRKFDVQMTPGI